VYFGSFSEKDINTPNNFPNAVFGIDVIVPNQFSDGVDEHSVGVKCSQSWGGVGGDGGSMVKPSEDTIDLPR
jgi:hypothetical protein